MQAATISSAASRVRPRNAERRSNSAYTASASNTPTASATTSSHEASRGSGFWITSLRNPAPAPMSPASAYSRAPLTWKSWRSIASMNSVPSKNSGVWPAFSMVRPA